MSIFSIFKSTKQDEETKSSVDVTLPKHIGSEMSSAGNISQNENIYKEAFLKINEVFSRSCDGDLEPRILNVDHEDKAVTDTFIALNRFLDQTDAYIRESAATMEKASDKKYYRRFFQSGFGGLFRSSAGIIDSTRQKMQDMQKENQEKTRGFANDFEEKISGVVQSLSEAVTHLGGASDTMVSKSEDAHHQAEEMVSATQQVTHNVGAVASATEELSGSINEISAQVAASSAAIKETVVGAEAAGKAVAGLEDSANEIDKVVELIRGIAGQTNLLALNATIEAARAGDAGKGFAVVASEVKSLANETASATDDIVQQVSNIQNAIKHTVSAIGEIQEKVGEVDEYAASISTTVNEQNAATVEISRNIQEAATRTEDVSGNICKISEASGETNKMATEVGATTTGIKSKIDDMEAAVGSFLKTVKDS